MKKEITIIMIIFILFVSLCGCNNKENNNFNIDKVTFSATGTRFMLNWIDIEFNYNANQYVDEYDVILDKVEYTIYGNEKFLKKNSIEFVDITSGYIMRNFPVPIDKELGSSKSFHDYFFLGSANVDGVYDWKIDCSETLKDEINRWIRNEIESFQWRISGVFSFYLDNELYQINFNNTNLDEQ